MTLELDHALFAVHDLAAADRELERRYGLASVEGGRHTGWGTANRIVPLGDTYLELIAIVDEAEAATSTLGRWVNAHMAEGIRPIGWSVRTDDLDSIAARLRLPVMPGSRARPDGSEVRWRTVGVEEAVDEPYLPFFIEREVGAPFPGRVGEVQAASIAEVRVRGNSERLHAWLGDYELPVEIVRGDPELTAVTLASPAGLVEIAAA